MWCNHTAEKILGYGREHMIGQDIRDFQTTGAGDSISAKVQIRDTCSIKYLKHGIMGRKLTDGGLLRYRK